MKDPKSIKLPIVRQITKYVLRILKVFGLYEEDIFPSGGEDEESKLNEEEVITPLVNALVRFRD